MRLNKNSGNAIEPMFELLYLIMAFLITIVPTQLILYLSLRSFKIPLNLARQAGLLRVRLYRYALALIAIQLDSRSLKIHFSSGSRCANLFMYLMEPAFKCIQPSKAEHKLIKRAKESLSRGFDPNSLLVASLYLHPYELDPELRGGLFSEATAHSELAPIYIRYLFSTNQFYVLPGESEKHLQLSELAMKKMCKLLERSSSDEREKLTTYLQYYVQGSLPLMGYSDQRSYQSSKIALLLEYLKVKQAHLFALPEYVPALSQSKKRIGLIRFSIAHSAESEQVFAAMRNPPDGLELFLFVFDMDEQECQRLTETLPWLNGKVRKLNINDLAMSLTLIREHCLDILINTSPLSGRFVNEISILLAFRAARVQAMFISDVVTSGIPNVDYFIVPESISSKTMQSQFTETLLVMNGLFGVILLHKDSHADTTQPRLTTTGNTVLLGSNAHVMKLSAEVLQTWATILKVVENSRIILMPFPNEGSKIYRHGLQRSILNVCTKTGIDPDRLVIIEASGRSEVCQNLRACDIYLDTFPYSGSISIFDALSTEKPLITLKGSLFRSGFAAGILDELELQEKMVANSLEEYIALAVEQAQDKNLRDTLSSRIRNNIATHPHAFDADSLSAEFYRVITKLLA